MNIIKNLQSTTLLINYSNWVKNITLTKNNGINNIAKVSALALSLFVLLGSIAVFIFNDIPELIKAAYNSLKKKNPTVLQLTKAFFLAGSSYLLYQKFTSLFTKLKKVQNIATLTIAIAGLGISAYYMGYLSY